jgi:hypothetical protein
VARGKGAIERHRCGERAPESADGETARGETPLFDGRVRRADCLGILRVAVGGKGETKS